MGKINTKSHQGTKGCVTHTQKKKPTSIYRKCNQIKVTSNLKMYLPDIRTIIIDHWRHPQYQWIRVWLNKLW